MNSVLLLNIACMTVCSKGVLYIEMEMFHRPVSINFCTEGKIKYKLLVNRKSAHISHIYNTIEGAKLIYDSRISQLACTERR